MTNSPVIQSLWIGDELSNMEKLSIHSFLKKGHEFHLYTYGAVKGIPRGTIVRDANTIIPNTKIFRYKKSGGYSGFSNLFRYKLLLEKGGYWSDVDVICLKPICFTDEHVFCSERKKIGLDLLHFLCKRFIRGELRISKSVTNCFMKAPVGSKVMKYCFEESLKKDVTKLRHGETGPALLDEAVSKFNFTQNVLDYKVINPIGWWNTKELTSSRKSKWNLPNSTCIHLYNEMWRQNKIDKNSTKFPKDSLFEQLKLKS